MLGGKKCSRNAGSHSSKSAAPKCSDWKLHNLLFLDLKAFKIRREAASREKISRVVFSRKVFKESRF